MAEKANIIVEIAEEWFEKHWWYAAIWCCMNMKKGCSVERTFGRFQVQEDADKFKKFVGETAL